MLNKLKKIFNISMIMISIVCCVTMFTACKKKKSTVSPGTGGSSEGAPSPEPSQPAIVAVALNSDMINLEYSSVEYNRTYREPTVVVKNGETVIPEEAYDVNYSNNKEVGTATVLVEAAEGSLYLTGSASKTFEITIANLLPINDLSYALHDGESHAPNNLTLIDGLIYGTDFDVVWQYKENGASDSEYVTLDTTVNNFIEIGYYKVTATGKGNYTGTQTAVFGIYKELPEVQEIDPVAYSAGTKQVPTVVLANPLLEVGVDYEISYEFKQNGTGEFLSIDVADAKSFINAGEYKVVVSGLGLYGGKKEVSFMIESIEIPDVTLTPVADLVYDATSKSPIYSGVVGLTENTDYRISWKYKEFGNEEFENYPLNANPYKRFINAGEYKIVVTGIGNYSGTAEASFTIQRADFEATVSKEDYTFNGESEPVVVDGNNGGEVTYYITKDGSIIDKLDNAGWIPYKDGDEIDAGNYFIHAKIAASKNYNAIVTPVSNFEVFKDELNGIPDFTSLVFYYNGKSQLPKIEITSVLCSDPEKFVEGRDYNLFWEFNMNPYEVDENSFIDPGYYTVTIYPIGNYEITKQDTYRTTYFEIKALTFDDFHISRENYYYGGEKSAINLTHVDSDNGIETLGATIKYECRRDGTDDWFVVTNETDLEIGKYWIRATASLRGYSTKTCAQRSFNVLASE